MSSSSLFPPPLTLHIASSSTAATAADGQSHSISHHAQPNLMPFSINYTGPANVDGYLIPHTLPSSSSSSSTPNKAEEEREEEVYSHFRGRRIWRTSLPLPQGWTGMVHLLQREGISQGHGSGHDPLAERHRNGDVSGSNRSSGRSHRMGLSLEEEEEREEIRRRRERKKRKLSLGVNGTSGAKNASRPKAAVMASFSMDDDEEEEQGQEEEQSAWTEDDLEEDEHLALQADEEVEDPYLEEDHITQRSSALDEEETSQNAQATSLQQRSPFPPSKVTTDLLPLPLSSFSSIAIWSPDGKLDKGDEELFKVFGEWRSVNALLHTA